MCQHSRVFYVHIGTYAAADHHDHSPHMCAAVSLPSLLCSTELMRMPWRVHLVGTFDIHTTNAHVPALTATGPRQVERAKLTELYEKICACLHEARLRLKP